ncbi:hypothetical protein ACFQ88_35050 [Paenibacillus sp. NPDC056579]|uniref:hypothetical protein n=1 Tax=unclassified Paenibacillus TaxID=185978 RepID=UPI001EF75B66|nr:hypothetical protein [Paenibacillus sp. H1-7]ULL18177.1 hypothetical protein DVH26_29165 [Paenibacillus sp. H1-7]
MPRLLYEYIYVNMWILLFMTFLWTTNGQLTYWESGLLIVVSVTVIALVANKQDRPDRNGTYKKPPL